MDFQKKMKRSFLGVLVVFIGMFIFMTWFKHSSLKQAEAERLSEINKGKIVSAAKVIQTLPEHTISVNGETRPYQSVTLYAKVSGYLKNVLVDKGDVVTAGQVLAEIESPETDEAYLASLANYENKRDIAKRDVILQKEDLISEQEREQAVSDAQIAESQHKAQKVIKGYEMLKAPFAGTITARFADPGALVQNAETSQNSALPVVTVSEVKRLRVDVFLDQQDAPYVKKDDPVKISLPEHPETQVLGRVDRIANELDPTAKLMLVEIDIPNDKNTIVAGSFVQVSIQIKSPSHLIVPVEALVLKEKKPYVGVISTANKIQYRPIEIDNNDGKRIFIRSGVQKDDIVALSLGDGGLAEGSLVRPIIRESK